jgi:FKBP-type peptidyl-prolyl cis-trans isomerase FkpA
MLGMVATDHCPPQCIFLRCWLPLAVAMAMAACSADAGDRPAATETTGTAVDAAEPVVFAPELGIDSDALSPAGDGVLVQDVRPGRGRVAESGSTVVVEYRGYLPDGTLFEQRPSADGFGPSEFVLGEGAPVPGLSTGITGMRVDGVRRVVVPPEQGYGLVGRPAGVPAGATLVFEVRLLRVAPPPPPVEQ